MKQKTKVFSLKASIVPEVKSEALRLLTSAECHREIKSLKVTGTVTRSLENLAQCRA
jgi:hypothetical protein